MHIAIIGAGLVGMTAARRLLRDGHSLTVIDAAEGPGRGASHANGAQLSYSYVAPLADGSIWRQLPKLVLSPGSPVRFRPGADPFQYRWLLRFLAACTDARARDTMDRLGLLAALSREALHAADDLAGHDFGWTRTGKLVAYSSAAGLDAARRMAEHQARAGVHREVLDRDGCLGVEPALAPIAHRLVGGLFSPGDEAADPFRLCLALGAVLIGSGRVRTLYGTRVAGLRREGRRIAALDTDAGPVEADAYVLAAGNGARRLGRTAGLDLPVYPLKGYSLTVPVAEADAAPTVSITDAARKVVIARLGGALRLAGAADLIGENLDIDTRRTGRLVADAAADFPRAADWRTATLWAGLRPATPKGLPILGDSGIDNLVLSVGHGALGLTLAFGSAELVAAHLAGRAAAVPIGDFHLSRA